MALAVCSSYTDELPGETTGKAAWLERQQTVGTKGAGNLA